mmetsp:Transcript_8883/g.12663  ORF Transcript_8883/g.12663 Transcript_8883/m.12663 type:complete len:1009 (-) Transcript_8883:242-3268(-)|eukprot:CAMPEP_0184870924 /NCGR_PEP_ID=MMETSP0580-20130426/39243_1 /TAXON_ID=1118495 /ORGANISM="Dactyliosolen fragilissimus" /LENGTH=1008 /DNA_ID=CAMNT_0027373301 /DNA_START=46 /DNA_END=3072 /DNA_ORIENTATION=+
MSRIDWKNYDYSEGPPRSIPTKKKVSSIKSDLNFSHEKTPWNGCSSNDLTTSQTTKNGHSNRSPFEMDSSIDDSLSNEKKESLSEISSRHEQSKSLIISKTRSTSRFSSENLEQRKIQTLTDRRILHDSKIYESEEDEPFDMKACPESRNIAERGKGTNETHSAYNPFNRKHIPRITGGGNKPFDEICNDVDRNNHLNVSLMQAKDDRNRLLFDQKVGNDALVVPAPKGSPRQRSLPPRINSRNKDNDPLLTTTTRLESNIQRKKDEVSVYTSLSNKIGTSALSVASDDQHFIADTSSQIDDLKAVVSELEYHDEDSRAQIVSDNDEGVNKKSASFCSQNLEDSNSNDIPSIKPVITSILKKGKYDTKNNLHNEPSYNSSYQSKDLTYSDSNTEIDEENGGSKDDDVTIMSEVLGEDNTETLVQNRVPKNTTSFDQVRNHQRRRGKRRNSRRYREEDSDDDTSIEGEDTDTSGKKRADTLQDRAKQAWSVRNKATATKSKPVESERVTFVNFADAEKNTVYEFVPDVRVDSDGNTEVTDFSEGLNDDDTYAGRSMNSEYTKSNESEVEDFFKDLFFIGGGKATNPGRRRLKYRGGKEYEEPPNVNDKGNRFPRDIPTTISQTSDNEDEETILTLPTLEPSPNAKENKRSKKNRKKDKHLERKKEEQREEEGDNTLAEMWNIVQDGVNVISSAFGLNEKEVDTIDENSYPTENSIMSSNNGSVTVDSTDRKQNSKKVKRDLKNIGKDSNSEIDQTSIETEIKLNKSSSSDDIFEEDVDLMRIAVNAAKIKHNLVGLTYDEETDLNVHTEIRFVLVVIALPLGLQFEEDDKCCWIKRIFTAGNAAISFRGDKVEIGDQLVAVNGTSALYKSVSRVCKLLSEVPDPNKIEMTFLRYVGPLRMISTGPQQQEGYEVIDRVHSQHDMIDTEKKYRKIAKQNQGSPLVQNENKNTTSMNKDNSPVMMDNEDQKYANEEKSNPSQLEIIGTRSDSKGDLKSKKKKGFLKRLMKKK